METIGIGTINDQQQQQQYKRIIATEPSTAAIITRSLWQQWEKYCYRFATTLVNRNCLAITAVATITIARIWSKNTPTKGKRLKKKHKAPHNRCLAGWTRLVKAGWNGSLCTDIKQKCSNKGQTPVRTMGERHAIGAWQVKPVLRRLDRIGVLSGVLLESVMSVLI